MKYLKLFEDHKETSDKISEIEKDAQKQTEEVINGYKKLIDEMFYEISDDYDTQSEIKIKDIKSSIKTYIDYKIHFTADKYEDVLDKLLEIVDRLKDVYDISYSMEEISSISGYKLGYLSSLRKPFDFYECKNLIKKFIEGNLYMKKEPSDVKLILLISF